MIETNNLYYASYLFSEGLNLKNVEKRDDQRFGDTIVFVFYDTDHDREQRLIKRYEDSTASTNIRKYLFSLERIRDIMHSIMNKGTRAVNISGPVSIISSKSSAGKSLSREILKKFIVK